MELISKLESYDTSKIGMLPSASKDVSIKFVDQCRHILNNKERLNGIKGITNMQKRESILNINHMYKIFKGTLVLITEVWKCHRTTNRFHD